MSYLRIASYRLIRLFMEVPGLCEIRTEGIDLLAAQAPFQRLGVNLLADSISPESAQGSKPAAKFIFYDTLESGLS